MNKEHPDTWQYAGTTDTEEHRSIRTRFEDLCHMLESHIFLVMLCQQLLSAEGTVGTASATPRAWDSGKETQIFPSQKASYGNALLLFHSQIIFISGRKWRPQRKKVMDSWTLRHSVLSEGWGTNIALHAMRFSYCYYSAAGEYLHPRPLLGSVLWISPPAEQAEAGSSHGWHLAWRMFRYVNSSFRNRIQSLNEGCKFAGWCANTFSARL